MDKKRTSFKNLLALTLAFVMTVGIMPFSAIAAETQAYTETVGELSPQGETMINEKNTAHGQELIPISDTLVDSGVIRGFGDTNLPWRLYEGGTLVFDGGFYDVDHRQPWYGELNRHWRREHRENIVKIVFTAPVIGGRSVDHMFSGIPNLVEFVDISYLDVSRVRSMQGMFQNAFSLAELDLSGWDTSNVTIMENMFSGARALTSLDLSSWDIGRVSRMTHMFRDASGITNLNLYGWDTRNAWPMTGIFNGTTGLRSLTLGPDFRINAFYADAMLPQVLSNDTYTGFWIHEDNQTRRTSAQLMGNNFIPGTWTWERHNHVDKPVAHSIIVNAGTATPSLAYAGEFINLRANAAPSGSRFAGWTSNDVVITNANIANGATFTMIDAPVTITANFEITGSNIASIREILAHGDAIVSTQGNLGIFSHHGPLVIPAGRTLVITTALNVQRDAELIIEGTLIVSDNARINNQGSATGGGTIVVANGGELINNGHIENATGSTVINYGTIVNNARFEVRAETTLNNCGDTLGKVPLNIHRNAINIFCNC